VQLRFCLDSYDRTQNLPAANDVVLAAAQRLGGDLELSLAWYLRGRTATDAGAYNEAAGYHALAIEHAIRAGNAEYQAACHGGLSVAFGHLGRADAALEHIRQAVELA
jgi:hypothetical protein